LLLFPSSSLHIFQHFPKSWYRVRNRPFRKRIRSLSMTNLPSKTVLDFRFWLRTGKENSTIMDLFARLSFRPRKRRLGHFSNEGQKLWWNGYCYHCLYRSTCVIMLHFMRVYVSVCCANKLKIISFSILDITHHLLHTRMYCDCVICEFILCWVCPILWNFEGKCTKLKIV